MADLLENLLVMVLSIVVLVGGIYLLLLVLDLWLKFKSGLREQEGLTNLWLSAKQTTPSQPCEDEDEVNAGLSIDPNRKEPEI